MATTYNNLYLDIRQQLRRAGIEEATLEARELVCFGTNKSREELARDGGLLTPEVLPKLTPEMLEDLRGKSYSQRAVAVMKLFLEDFSEDGVYPDGTLVMDARGATLHQMLYYVGKDCPVAAYEPDGSYLLITGYDQTHVSFTDPSTGETSRMGLEEGTAYWEARQNDFVCGLYK